MSVLTLTSVKAAWYTLIASGSALSAARATLGAGGVMTRKAWKKNPTAVGPLIVVQYGPVTGQQGYVRTFYPTLWLYDDGGYEWERLNPLADLIEVAITPEAIAYCDTRYSTGIGPEVIEDALGRPALSLRYQIRGRF